MVLKRKEKRAQEYVNKLRDVSSTIEQLIWDVIKDLRESEQRYRSIVEFAADAIITIDQNNQIISWNEGATNIFHYAEEEAIGKNIDHLIAKNGVETEAFQLSQRVLQGDSFRSIEAVRSTKEGESRQVLISAAPIKSTDGKVEAASIMYKDITELKRAHQQLVQTEKQATLGIIAGNIGHELNNLVGGLLLHAKLLKQNDSKPEKVKEITEMLLTNLEKVALHGKNLLSLSRPTKPSFEPLDLNSVLLETTETLVLSGVLKHYDIEKNMCETTRYVKGDRNLLEQVFRNLEINAVHAMPEGGKLTLETQFSRDEHFFEVKISDTGSGIPKEIQAKIFEPFFTTKAEGVGTGLGLPIVKDIIEKHKGYIDLESEKDQGTIVTVGIPIVKSL